MSQKTFSFITGLLFMLVAAVHLLRIAEGWGLALGGIAIPMWLSWVGLLVTGVLAYYGIRFGTENSGKPILK